MISSVVPGNVVLFKIMQTPFFEYLTTICVADFIYEISGTLFLVIGVGTQMNITSQEDSSFGHLLAKIIC